MDTTQLKSFARSKFAWPGGYPLFAVCTDGAALCHQCTLDNYREILTATKTGDRNGWAIEAITVNWEDDMCFCEHCGERIESAYAED